MRQEARRLLSASMWKSYSPDSLSDGRTSLLFWYEMESLFYRAVILKYVVPKSAASVSPGNLWEMHIHRLHPRTPESGHLGERPSTCAISSPAGNLDAPFLWEPPGDKAQLIQLIKTVGTWGFPNKMSGSSPLAYSEAYSQDVHT